MTSPFKTIYVGDSEFTVTNYAGSNAPAEYVVERVGTDYAAIARHDSAGVSVSAFGDADGTPDPAEHTYRDDLIDQLGDALNEDEDETE